MSKPYHEMTAAERTAARIAKNREIEQRVMEKKPPEGKVREGAARQKVAGNVLDKFQEIKRTHGIDAASEFVRTKAPGVS